MVHEGGGFESLESGAVSHWKGEVESKLAGCGSNCCTAHVSTELRRRGRGRRSQRTPGG